MKPCIIIPSSLTSVFARDTRASALDCIAVSRIFEQSLTARGKHLPSRTWLRKWKTDSWIQPLFSRTFELSLGTALLDSWLAGFSHSVGHVSLSVSQDSEKRSMMSGGCSTSLQMESPSCSPECFSPKTSKDCLPRECQTVLAFSDTASRDWKGFITGLRQAYSARLKSAHRTSASGCSSWPTASARDGKDSPGAWMYAVTNRNREDQLARKVYSVEFGRAVLAETTDANGNHPVSSTYRLNPRWVETLMGIPVGWVMPGGKPYRITSGYATRMIAVSTNSDSSETVSSQQPPS
jgi:hypothetical protein